MAGAGGALGWTDYSQRNQPAQTNNPLAANNGLYNQGVQQNAEDYSSIMQGYKDLQAKASSIPTQVQPTFSTYSQSGDTSAALSNLKDLSANGGYDAQGISDLRARAISPIRSIYSSAQEGLNRNKRLQGGYSPNFAAASTKLARDESNQIGTQVTNANAALAQQIAQNRLQAAPQYGSLAAGQSDLANQIAGHNADTANQVGEFNTSTQQNQNDLALKALQGQSSLYGTTPALANLFGTQALQQTQQQNNTNQQNANRGLSAANQLLSLYGG